MPDEQERPDYVKLLKDYETLAFAEDIHGDHERGIYSVIALSDHYRGLYKKKFGAEGDREFALDAYLQEGLRQAQAGYRNEDKTKRAFGNAGLKVTMENFAKAHQEIWQKKANMSEVYTYLSEMPGIDRAKELFDKYGDKTLGEIDNEEDQKKLAIIISTYVNGRFEKLIPKMGDRFRESSLEAILRAGEEEE